LAGLSCAQHARGKLCLSLSQALGAHVASDTAAKKIASRGKFFLHRGTVGPICKLTPREKKREKAANGTPVRRFLL
jgi:hypothetical protein